MRSVRGKGLNARVPEHAVQRLQTLLRCVNANFEPLLVFQRCVSLVTSLCCDLKTLGHLTGCVLPWKKLDGGDAILSRRINNQGLKCLLPQCRLILVCRIRAASAVPSSSTCAAAEKLQSRINTR
jgi:hypothetical protein